MEKSTIGDRIARRRRAMPMTQEALAEAAGLSVETIRKLEQHKSTTPRLSTMRLSTMGKIARALQVPTSQLIGDAAQAAAEGDPDVDGVALIELRKALTPARGLRGVLVVGPELEPPTLDDVRGSIRLLDRRNGSLM